MKKISIIVPVYNVEPYLRKCLNSLVQQTMLDLEILIVNDGSTDGSQEIIDEFSEDYSQIKPFIKTNGGLGDARNFGIERASGEYLAFVDSDDWVTKNMFEEMYHLAKKHDADIVLCNLEKVDEKGNTIRKIYASPDLSGKIELASHFSVFSDIFYFSCNKIYKKTLFQKHLFKKNMHFEDVELIPKLLLESKILAQTQSFHYKYLERPNSITKTHTKKGLDVFKAIKEVKNSFDNGPFRERKEAFKNFEIMQGVYSFLAYLAFVKDKYEYKEMSLELKKFIVEEQISKLEMLKYRRFGKNYLLSLPLKKRIFYLLYFFGQERLMRILMRFKNES